MAETYFGWCEMNVGPTRSTTVSFLALRPCSASHFFDDICLHHSPQQLQSDISPHVRMAKYCDERVCVFVCPWAYIQNCMSDLHQIFVHLTQFFYFTIFCVSYRVYLIFCVSSSPSGDVAICYVLPVLWMTKTFVYATWQLDCQMPNSIQ